MATNPAENTGAANPNQAATSELLKIEPMVLNFEPPLNKVITQNLKLTNLSKEFYVAYKVKTTHPKRYCVRPNLGIVGPGETTNIQVLLHYAVDPVGVKSKDRFQVQSFEITKETIDGPLDNIRDLRADALRELWLKIKDDSVRKQKLKVTFASSDNRSQAAPVPRSAPQPLAKSTDDDTAFSEQITALNKKLDTVSRERDELKENLLRLKSRNEQLEKHLAARGSRDQAVVKVVRRTSFIQLLIFFIVFVIIGRLSTYLI